VLFRSPRVQDRYLVAEQLIAQPIEVAEPSTGRLHP